MRDLYQRARAFVYAAEEDFGIAPLEAQATGLPVVGYAKGGLLETVVPLNGAPAESPPTGVFFKDQDKDSLIEAIIQINKRRDDFSPQDVRNHSLKFSRETFKREISRHIGAVLDGRA